jgi:DNA processing protein
MSEGSGTAPEAERLARVALSRIAEPGHPLMTDVVHELDGRTVLTQLRENPGSDGHAADLAARISSVDPEHELEQAERRGFRFVVPGDPEWPSGLEGLALAPHLHERGGVPLGLWCRGSASLAEVTERAVAVVGSRSATTYGDQVAREIAGVLARESWTVVSGAAFGIDQAAHRGALAHRGPTVAVLACGVDRAYPSAHRGLIDYIADVGLVVSEAAPGCAPTRLRFLARNRLIAALARGTVVVEAAVRSGALNTASWTSGLGRPVMGVPGPVTSEPSAGVHQLIRTRDALLVTRGEEVLEVVAPMGSYTLVDLRDAVHPRDRLAPRERQVLDAVPLVHAVDSQKIAKAAGVSWARTKEALLALHRAGLVEHSLGRWRVVADPEESGNEGAEPP